MRIVVVLSFVVLSGCPKGGGAADPKRVEPEPEPEPAAEVAIHDAGIVCLGPEDERAVFTLELTYAEGCPVIPSEYDGEIHELELEVEQTPAKLYIVQPVDLATEELTWVSAGCGARVHFEGAIGTLDLDFAALDNSDAAGTGTWTPAGAAPCEVTLAGPYSNYARREAEDEEDYSE